MAAVSVIGLGKLGSSLLAVMATKHEVLGVDLNKETVAKLNAGGAPVVEPGLAELLTRHRARYRATTDVSEIVETDVTFIIVPTPSDSHGVFDNKFVLQAVCGVGKAIVDKETPHLVVITSTVMPGSTMGPIARSLTLHAKKELGPELGLCYSPEFIALGNVIHDMQRPDMVLIGESSAAAGDRLERLLRSVLLNEPPAARLTVPEAEISKICTNCYVTTKMSFANTLAEICEKVPDTDARRIAKAVGLDSRIGSKFFRPATAWGGPCLSRDNQAFLAFAASVGAVAPIAEATIAVNNRQVDRLANLIETVVPIHGRVGILGMSYKPDTPVIDESVGIALALEMSRRDYSVYVHDPLAGAAAEERLGEVAVVEADASDLLRQVDVAVFVQPHTEYQQLENQLGALAVVDVWGVFQKRPCLRPGVYQWGIPA